MRMPAELDSIEDIEPQPWRRMTTKIKREDDEREAEIIKRIEDDDTGITAKVVGTGRLQHVNGSTRLWPVAVIYPDGSEAVHTIAGASPAVAERRARMGATR